MDRFLESSAKIFRTCTYTALTMDLALQYKFRNMLI